MSLWWNIKSLRALRLCGESPGSSGTGEDQLVAGTIPKIQGRTLIHQLGAIEGQALDLVVEVEMQGTVKNPYGHRFLQISYLHLDFQDTRNAGGCGLVILDLVRDIQFWDGKTQSRDGNGCTTLVVDHQLTRLFGIVENEADDRTVGRVENSDGHHVDVIGLQKGRQVVQASDPVFSEDGKLFHGIDRHRAYLRSHEVGE